MKQHVIWMVVVVMVGCGAKPLAFQPSGINTFFDVSPETPFEDYITHVRSKVETARVDLNDDNRKDIVEANTPFELIPDTAVTGERNGILLIHGLQDSPYQMRDLATHFHSNGFHVRTLLLPGHGTVPGDMLEVTYTEWIKAVEYGIHRFSTDVDRLFLGGFSTGGELALYMWLTGSDIKGLYLFAPVTAIKTKLAWVSTTFLAPDFLSTFPENDFARYESVASNAVSQVYQLTREVDHLMETNGTVTVPVFVALSEDDITVDSFKTMELFKSRFSSEIKSMIVYTAEPEKYRENREQTIIYRDSRVPKERIVSFSHLSLLVSPDDPHYGKDSDYVYPVHPLMRLRYGNKEGSDVYRGELMGKYQKLHPIRRLTYNPHFREMTRQMDAFTDKVLRQD